MDAQISLGTVVLVAAIYFGLKASRPFVKIGSWIVVGLLIATTATGFTIKSMIGEAGKGGASFVEQVKDIGGR